MTYEMLVGDPPHAASTAQAIIAKVLTETPTARAHQSAERAGSRGRGGRARAREAARGSVHDRERLR